MQAATASNPRRRKPRRVIYKSTALERTAPHLVAAASNERVSAAQSIQNANAAAENVRLRYKEGRGTQLAAVDGNDDASNAQKYERRLKMNRQSAAASRVRREAYTKALEAELVKMESEYKVTVVQLQAALERNRQLEVLKSPDDGEVPGAAQVKEEVEECDTGEVEESVEEDHDMIDDAAAALVDEDQDVLQALVELEPTDIDQFFTEAAQPKREQLLSNRDPDDRRQFLNVTVPDTLPDCFLHPPLDYDLAGDEFL